MILRPYLRSKEHYSFVKKYLEKFLLFNLPFIVGIISMIFRIFRSTFNNNFYYLIAWKVIQESVSGLFIFVYCFSQSVTHKLRQILCCKKQMEDIRETTTNQLMEEETDLSRNTDNEFAIL